MINRNDTDERLGMLILCASPAHFVFWLLVALPLLMMVPTLGLNFLLWLGIVAASLACLVLYESPPLPRISERSALMARVAWLGRYLLAGGVIFFGTFLGQAVDGLSVQESIEVLAGGFGGFVIPVGATVVGVLLFIDLVRIPATQRAVIFSNLLFGSSLSEQTRLRRAVARGLATSTSPGLVVAALAVAAFAANVLV